MINSFDLGLFDRLCVRTTPFWSFLSGSAIVAKILITTIPYWGHINVTLSLGMRLIEQGHEVTWALAKQIPGLIIPQGGRLALTNSADDEQLMATLDLLDSGKSKSALDGSVFVTEKVLLPLASMMIEGLRKIVDELQPDLIIHDEQTYVGGICASERGIPYVTTHAAPPSVYENAGTNVSAWYLSCMQKFQASFGFPKDPIVVRSKKLGLAFCPREFGDPTKLAEGQIFVGPCLDVIRPSANDFDFAFLTESNNKNIMVSIGTLLTAEAKHFFHTVVQDLGNKPYNVIVAGDPNLFDQWPDNFMVQQRVPHLELLAHLDLVITHGGANTTCDCIGMGIPMVVVPMAFDQFYVGDQVAANGLGIRLRYRRLRVGQISDACQRLLANDSIYNESIDKFSKMYSQAGGATKAAKLVEQFIYKECSRNV